MPTDSVKNRSFKEAFNGTVRFEIPFFQRGYAWEKRQWDQLFQDIQEQIMEELDRGSNTDNVEHFFGPIVVLERAGGALELKNFMVIDGQQRITTAYLLLALIRTELLAKSQHSDDAADYAHQLTRFLVNDVSGNDDYLKLKLFSSKGDRLPTYWVVFGANSNPSTPLLQSDLQLYIPATNRVDEFKNYAVKKLRLQYRDVPALWRLATVILNCLKIVWIPLAEGKDDPQAIFESLNDKGMALKASELLCNFLFRPIIDAKQNYEDLHNSRWLAAIKIIGGDDDFEEFLRNLFSIGENKMVGKGRKLYIQFKAKNRQLSATAARNVLDNIKSNAPLYMMIRNPRMYRHDDDAITSLLTFIRDTRMESSTPFVMAVLKSHQSNLFDISLTKRILHEVLVLLVRRKATELSTTQYDVMFPQLASKIQHEPDKIRALQKEFRDHGVWVSDQEFKEALISRPTYRARDLAFSRLLLIGIDKSFQAHGQFPDYTTVNTIEHTLPQTVDSEWSNYLGADANDERLVLLINTIGNLCLLSGPANSSAGQDPFVSKKDKYSPITALARQIKEHPGPWNLKSIMERSKVLAERACDVWSWS